MFSFPEFPQLVFYVIVKHPALIVLKSGKIKRDLATVTIIGIVQRPFKIPYKFLAV